MTRALHESQRPTIPPVAWFALAGWGGAVGGEALWWAARDGAGEGLPLVVLAVIAAATLLVSTARTRWRSLAILAVLGSILGCALSVADGVRVDTASATLRDCGARTWTGRVIADPREGTYGQRIQARLIDGPCAGIDVSVGWGEEDVPEIGQVVRFRAVLSPCIDDPEYGRRNVRAGLLGSGDAWLGTVEGWSAGIVGKLLEWRASAVRSCEGDGSSGSALLRGIALGDRRALRGTEVEQDFRILGLSHVLAVSGMHLGLVCALVFGSCRVMRCRRQVALLLVILAGAGFVVVTGMPVSAIRALAMVGAAVIAELAGVRRNGIASLSAAVLCLLVISPWGVFSIGLQLSVLAVGGLLLFGRLAGMWGDACDVGLMTTPVGVMSLTCIAQAVTAPVTMAQFGMFSILAPVANCLVLPLLPLALCTGLLGLIGDGIGLSFLGGPLVALSRWILESLASVVGSIASLPGAAVMVGDNGLAVWFVTVIAAVALWVFWPVPRTRGRARVCALMVVAVLAVCAVGPLESGGARLIVLDVGQGDAILLSEGGRSMLVDTGADGTVLRAALAREGVRRIDAIVLTHAHDDHTGGLEGLVGVAQVGWVGVPCCIESSAYASVECIVERLTPRGSVPVRMLSAGQRFSLGEMDIEVLWPCAGVPASENTNDTSVILMVKRGSFDAVLTGDAEGEVQEALAEMGGLRDVEVLKVPHHGSTNGLSEVGVNAWSPEVAIISVGEGNSFSHPHQETLDLLRSTGTRVYRTDTCGDVIIEISANGYRVWTRSLCENVRGPPVDRAGSSDTRSQCGGQEPGRAETGLSHMGERGAASG